jgi:hypothetical protein
MNYCFNGGHVCHWRLVVLYCLSALRGGLLSISGGQFSFSGRQLSISGGQFSSTGGQFYFGGRPMSLHAISLSQSVLKFRASQESVQHLLGD